MIAVAGTISAFFAFVLAKILAGRRRAAQVGPSTMVGQHGQVRRGGLVAVRGELWQARTSDGGPLDDGEEVEVRGVEGLSLVVRRLGAPAAV